MLEKSNNKTDKNDDFGEKYWELCILIYWIILKDEGI